MQAHPKDDGGVPGLSMIGVSRGLLELDSGTKGIDGTRELDQSTVTRQFDEASAVANQQWLKPSGAQPAEPSDRAALVTPHQAGVANHISSKNCRQSALLTRQRYSPG
jgi:hypothetical protein